MKPGCVSGEPISTKRFRRDEGGATAVMMAVTTPLLLSLAGLGAEGAMAYFKHATMQSVSDAAAFSAGAAFRAGGGVLAARAEAVAIAAAHGYVVGQNVAVTVNSPPSSGPNATNLQATEVILAFSQEPLLTRVFRKENYTISTRSVSIVGGTGSPGCIMTLDPTGADSLKLQGNPTVTANGCDVVVNSNNPSAASSGGSATLSAARLDIVGGVSTNGGGTLPPVNKIAANAVPDPYAGLPLPAPNCMTGADKSPPSGLVPPGVYCGGLTLKNGNFTLNGVYVMSDGPLTIGANAVVTGANVTIITLPSSLTTINIAANSSTKISAPTSGTYAGVAIFAAGGSAAYPDSMTWNGNPAIDITGAVYMPHTKLTLSGSLASKGAVCTQIVTWALELRGNAAVNSNCQLSGTKTFGVGGASSRVSLAD